MRFSLATVALIGLGNVLFSVNSAPASLIQRGSNLNIPEGPAKRAFVPPKAPHPDPEPIAPGHPTDPGLTAPHPAPVNPHAGPSDRPAEVLDPDTATTYTPKQVPTLDGPTGTKPYSKTHTPPEEADEIDGIDWPEVYDIHTDGYDEGESYVDRIGVNPDKGTVSVFEAWNGFDTNGPAQKLYLSDIIMSVFTAEGKRPSDLKLIHADAVVNEDSTVVFDSIFKSLGKDTKDDTVIFKSTDTGAMKDYFNRISNTPFPKVAARMNGEFSTGKTISQYKISPNPGGVPDLDIFLG